MVADFGKWGTTAPEDARKASKKGCFPSAISAGRHEKILGCVLPREGGESASGNHVIVTLR